MRSSNISVGLMVIIVITSVTPAFTQNKDSAAKTAEPEKPLNSLLLQDSIQVEDVDNDAGKQLRVSWEIEPVETSEKSDSQSEEPIKRTYQYLIERKLTGADGGDPSSGDDVFDPELPMRAPRDFELVGEVEAEKNEYIDKGLIPNQRYLYRVRIQREDGTISAPTEVGSATTIRQWIDKTKIAFGIFMLIVCGAVVYFIEMAKAGKSLKIRKIAGLEAIEEAVGRATEMGRDCLFVPGIQDINDIQTVAGITVLSHVAELTAEYDAGLDVPTTRSLVMTTARETVDGAYTAAGRPDLYNPDNIYYVTDEQFGFVAAVTGKMVREKPAACFYMGAFYAESLIFAETANTVGAIQIAGTAMPSQLPFFVAACDYVLIGEEFFAASAYLSGEPQQLGSLKGQDVGKFIAAIFLIVGAVLMTLGELVAPGSDGEGSGFLKEIIMFIKNGLLGN